MSATDANRPESTATAEEKTLFRELVFAIEGRTAERNAILGQFKQDFHEKQRAAKAKFPLYSELFSLFEDVIRPAAEEAEKQAKANGVEVVSSEDSAKYLVAWQDGKDVGDQKEKIEALKGLAGL